MNCTDLAHRLSTNFFSSTPFIPADTTLPSYLSSNGVLLSICGVTPTPNSPAAGGPCSVPPQATHLSASYINADIGASRFIPLSVGIVLDPTKINITCSYPTDAGTDGRDDRGCGPNSLDPKYGSKGAGQSGIIGRWITRRMIEWYSWKNFGNRPWEDIPCKEFFRLPDGLANGTVWRESEDAGGGGEASTARMAQSNDGATDDPSAACTKLKRGEFDFRFGTLESSLSRDLAAFLNHSPCRAHGVPEFEPQNWWEYDGACSWEPSEFQLMMDTMKTAFIKRAPQVILWNEVVAARPETAEEEREAIWGVFYIRYPNESDEALAKARKLAEKEAERLGRKPLLVLDLARYRKDGDHALFECDEALGENVRFDVVGSATADFEPLPVWMRPHVVL